MTASASRASIASGAVTDSPLSAASDEYAELAALLGDRFTADPFERGFYTRDLAPVPSLLARLVGRTLPDVVVRPANAEEVAAVLRFAARHRVPVTPRAAASTVYWNAVPVRGGILLDLNGMRGTGDVDEAGLTARVLPATRWDELARSLRRQGLDLLSYPTSAPSATVGGWLSMQGHGVGSLRHGGLASQVRRLQVVLPGGRIVEAGHDTTPAIAWFAGAEGTLGVVTRIDLAVRHAPEAERSFLVSLPDTASLQTIVMRLAAGELRPYCLHFSDAGFAGILRAAGFPVHDSAGPLLLVLYDGTAAEVSAGALAVERACAAAGGSMLGQDAAAAEWEERFTALRLKRAGPTLLAAESWLPVDQLAGYHGEVGGLARRQRLTMATYGMVVNPAEATVMTAFPSDETRTVKYLLDLSLTAKLYGISGAHGGRPYGTGVWNMPYVNARSVDEAQAELRARKQALDPLNIMNPGKLYDPPLVLRRRLFGWAMEVLALARSLGGRAW